MTTPPDDPRADEGLVDDATLIAVSQAIWDDCHGWFDPAFMVLPGDLVDTARAALAAARSHGGM